MDDELKPLSQLVAQGWEIVDSSSFIDSMGRVGHSVLLRLRRHRQHKFLVLETRFMGKGLVAKERDV
jgi:hypothetical protein